VIKIGDPVVMRIIGGPVMLVLSIRQEPDKSCEEKKTLAVCGFWAGYGEFVEKTFDIRCIESKSPEPASSESEPIDTTQTLEKDDQGYSSLLEATINDINDFNKDSDMMSRFFGR
jgi:hypothetical protein